MKEMGNLSHDRCYGTEKSTQKSGYGELTRLRKVSPTGSDTAYEGHPERLCFSACFVASGFTMRIRGCAGETIWFPQRGDRERSDRQRGVSPYESNPVRDYLPVLPQVVRQTSHFMFDR